jgi:hypothetical protein
MTSSFILFLLLQTQLLIQMAKATDEGKTEGGRGTSDDGGMEMKEKKNQN